MKVSEGVMRALDAAATDGAALRLIGQLDRKTYEAVNKAIVAVGGKWDRKRGAHIFDGDAAEAIEPILLTGEVTNRKQEFGQFDTPPGVSVAVIGAANIRPGMSVLEPSAGRGSLVPLSAKMAETYVDCVEIDPKRADYLTTVPGVGRIIRGDFLSVDPLKSDLYDRVVMNPPFAGQADIRHVLHALRFLKPGGRLVSIMSAGVAFRSNKLTAEFRALVAANGGTITALPDDSFADSGTSVRTVLVVIPN